jgi:hypothetical protein
MDANDDSQAIHSSRALTPVMSEGELVAVSRVHQRKLQKAKPRSEAEKQSQKARSRSKFEVEVVEPKFSKRS